MSYTFINALKIKERLSGKITDKERAKLEKELKDKSKVAMYLDINLFKQIEGENEVNIEEKNGKIKISFEIPESLRKTNREFYIIMVHNGDATKITSTINENTLTFETDKFSTYASVYIDATEETTSSTIPTISNTNNPKTGDNIMFYISMLGLSLIGFAGVGL